VTFCDMLPQSIPGGAMLAAQITDDSRMVYYMLSFNVNSQINLLSE